MHLRSDYAAERLPPLRLRFGAGPFERVGSVRAPGTTFTNRDLRPGTYRYAVTAQDTSVRANQSARSSEVTVTVP